ncbi:MAG TPA: hypothetical protein VN256_03435 [Pyrinomonadaceae bacterium]|nr:hypothetical protein [Pyrinomonadaceae bacterium]
MSVVIEEMEGTVEPEPTEPAEGGGQSSDTREQSTARIRHELSRLAVREARLRAD